MKTCPCDVHVYTLELNFYIEKLGICRGIPIFLIFAPKHRLWVLDEAVLTCTHNLCFEQKKKNTKIFLIKLFFSSQFKKNLCILHREIFVMQHNRMKYTSECRCEREQGQTIYFGVLMVQMVQLMLLYT